MKKFLVGASSIAALALPSLAFANSNSISLNLSGFQGSVASLTDAVNSLVPFGLAVAVIVFIYGIIRYIIGKDAGAQSEARSYMIWGVVGIAVILAVLGLAKLLTNLLGVQTGSGGVVGNDLPQVPNSAN